MDASSSVFRDTNVSRKPHHVSLARMQLITLVVAAMYGCNATQPDRTNSMVE
jgi:hypothetical protein